MFTKCTQYSLCYAVWGDHRGLGVFSSRVARYEVHVLPRDFVAVAVAVAVATLALSTSLPSVCRHFESRYWDAECTLGALSSLSARKDERKDL